MLEEKECLFPLHEIRSQSASIVLGSNNNNKNNTRKCKFDHTTRLLSAREILNTNCCLIYFCYLKLNFAVLMSLLVPFTLGKRRQRSQSFTA